MTIGDGGTGLDGAEERGESLQGNSTSMSMYGLGSGSEGFLDMLGSGVLSSLAIDCKCGTVGGTGCAAFVGSIEDSPSSAAVTPTESLEYENPGCVIASLTDGSS